MSQLLIVSFLLGVLAIASAHRLCNINADCNDLGTLECIKSACNWGVCGCQRGYASRFVGSSKGYRCVEMKKIGESCATDDTTGVCGASNSDCVDGVCTCNTNYEARWGGEECLFKQTPYPSETCSASLGASCGGSSSCASNGAWNGQYTDITTGNLVSNLLNSPFDDVPNVCACSTGYRTVLPNDFDLSPFVGSKVPTCEMNAVGDMCYHSQDCGQIQKADGVGGFTTTDAANCSNNMCVCLDSNHVPDISGLYCADPLTYGDSCMSSNAAVDSLAGVCNGNLGLRCGDSCDLSTFLDSGNFTCACDPKYTDNAGTCTANAVGSTCYGDLNCKAISDTAVCVDSLCAESGVNRAAFNVVLLLVTSLLSLIWKC